MIKEERYIIFKIKNLTEEQVLHLKDFESTLSNCQKMKRCVVVEEDWPEYLETLKKLEERVDSTPIGYNKTDVPRNFYKYKHFSSDKWTYCQSYEFYFYSQNSDYQVMIEPAGCGFNLDGWDCNCGLCGC